MKEIIDLLSSITVLIAALAGMSAVNKWKKERFDKVKIEAVEKYEESIINFANSIENILNKDDLDFYLKDVGSGSEEIRSVPEQIYTFYDDKFYKIENLKKDFDEVDNLYNTYSGYAGNKLVFSENYYHSVFLLMRFSVMCFKMELSEIEDLDKEFVNYKKGYFMVSFLNENRERFDMVDYMMISSPDFVLMMGGYDRSLFKDERITYKDIFLNIVSAEKMALHSSFLESVFIKIKIFIMKYRVVGRVLCISDRKAVVVGIGGAVFKCSTEGENYKVVEAKNRKNLFKKLLKSEIIRFFS